MGIQIEVPEPDNEACRIADTDRAPSRLGLEVPETVGIGLRVIELGSLGPPLNTFLVSSEIEFLNFEN